jgi:gamma-glutamylcyclotransferase (GGCT)/AIG2-like uncharacterized protein YtfP
MPSDPVHFFVYGTLKRNGLYAAYWPWEPIHVVTAFLHASLYDLGPYPALVDGSDLIRGECWSIPASGCDQTLQVLDDLESVAEDLYRRECVNCWNEHGVVMSAYAYFFARPEQLRPEQRIRPNSQGFCEWISNSVSPD